MPLLDVGSFCSGSCAGMARRSFLRIGGLLPLALTLPASAKQPPPDKSARARSVIFVFLWGGPSHLDTFDPKPAAPVEYRGPLATISTRLPGVHFSELLPRLAARNDRFTLIRSHTQTAPGHPDAGTVALTGFEERPLPVQPNFGSIVAAHRGHRGNLPPFVSLASGKLADSARIIEGWGAGTLASSYDPFMVNCSEKGHVELPALRILDGLSPNRINDRQSLLQRLSRDLSRIEETLVGDWNNTHRRAYELLVNPAARHAFDLTRESPKTRDRYGQTSFGQSALLARRLVEAGVPYVQLNYSRHPEGITPGYEFGWDTHIYNFEMLQDQHCPIFDRAFSALLDDLEARGLMEETLVVAMGEFGRTPKINQRASRDHWPRCYFSLWAGAGLEPGRVIGESDRLGEDPVTRPITPLMVGTTIAELVGMGTQARAAMNVLTGGTLIDELF